MHEAPEIDGIVYLPTELAVGSLVDVTITGAAGNIGYALAFRIAAGQMLGIATIRPASGAHRAMTTGMGRMVRPA